MSGDDGLAPEHERKIFVGGLSYLTTDESLKEYFQTFGDIVDCIVMKDSVTRNSRGFGFVAYDKPECVEKVQSGRPHIVDGKEVDTKQAQPREASGGRSSESQSKVKKIFVGGLKDGMTSEALQDYFGQFGTVTLVQVMEDSGTGKMRGFGFVTFDDYDTVEKALAKTFHDILGQKIEAKRARSIQQMQSGDNRNPRGGRGGGRGGGFGGYGRGQSNWGGQQSGYGGQPGSYGGYGDYSGGQQAYAQAYGGGYQQQQAWGGSAGWGGESGYSNQSWGQGYQGYGTAQGGGPMTQEKSYSHRSTGPYGSSYGGAQGGGYQQRQ